MNYSNRDQHLNLEYIPQKETECEEEQFFVNLTGEHSLKKYKDNNYGLWSFPEGMPVFGQIKGRDEWTFGTTVNGFSSEYVLSEVRVT
jgi:hypothetical protein